MRERLRGSDCAVRELYVQQGHLDEVFRDITQGSGTVERYIT